MALERLCCRKTARKLPLYVGCSGCSSTASLYQGVELHCFLRKATGRQGKLQMGSNSRAGATLLLLRGYTTSSCLKWLHHSFVDATEQCSDVFPEKVMHIHHIPNT